MMAFSSWQLVDALRHHGHWPRSAHHRRSPWATARGSRIYDVGNAGKIRWFRHGISRSYATATGVEAINHETTEECQVLH